MVLLHVNCVIKGQFYKGIIGTQLFHGHIFPCLQIRVHSGNLFSLFLI